MKYILINILSFTTIISSVLVITSQNPVISVVYLISVFVNAAGYLILSGIGFLGLSYIIVYVGAITVLFLFVIMMINISLTDIIDTGKQYTKNLPLAFVVSSLFMFEMFNILPFSFNNTSGLNLIFDTITNFNLFIWNNNELQFVNDIHTTYQSNIADITFISFSQIEAIGQLIYTYAAVLLIICSIILLLSMIAPIFISLKK
uniref:NADH-ubiquinone oxidoreductase chain 6 n=1 Tax=Russula subnigricans TaxID=258989 RepID=A0A649WI20_9AGAM|nr:NADH dehydrogenase subunit 6 [Russula subnigricans]QGK88079.1 NADH dehydrogenase subunit 6 [Russula subnigricans]